MQFLSCPAINQHKPFLYQLIQNIFDKTAQVWWYASAEPLEKHMALRKRVTIIEFLDCIPSYSQQVLLVYSFHRPVSLVFVWKKNQYSSESLEILSSYEL